MKKIVTTIGLIALSFFAKSQEKITITSSMVTDLKKYPYSSPYSMFDEQAGIKTENITSNPVTRWGDFMETDKYYPLSAIVDLKTETSLTGIQIYDNNGMSDLSFYYKAGTEWKLLFTDKLENYQEWNKHSVNVKTRFVKIVSVGPGGTFGEVVMFKAPSSIVAAPAPAPSAPAPTEPAPAPDAPAPAPAAPAPAPAIPAPTSGSQIKLTITSDMIMDEKAYHEASPFAMFDEQSGINAQPPTSVPKTSWGNYINKEFFYPLSSIIDLGQSIKISNIYIYDGGGTSDLLFYAKINGSWELLFKDGLQNYNTWNKHVVNKATQQIRVVSTSPNGFFGEVVIYGDKNTIKPAAIALSPKAYPVLEDFIGLNVLHTNSIKDASIVKHVRQFHQWTWNEANTDIANYAGFPLNKYGFNPSPGTWWNFDEIYNNYKTKGMDIVPVLQGTAFWFNKGLDGSKQNFKPIKDGANPENPASYIAHADYLYQFAARYGSKKLSTSLLKLQLDNKPSTGLNSISGIENWNEPNKTWTTRAGMFTPYEFAAMTSADYDGHQSKLGTNVGVKNADPNLPLIMAGLTEMDTTYTKSMLYWFKNNRTDGVVPFDVINYHHYSNDAGGQLGAPTFGVSPEADQLEKKVKGAVDFNRKHLPGKSLWLTEFGYDVAQTSPQKANAYGSYTGEDVQAMWMVRSVMAIYAGGADKAFLFWLQDDDSRNTYLYGTSGLMSSIPGSAPKHRKSYYWLSTLTQVAGKYKLNQKTVSGNIHKAEFIHPSNSDTTVYCLWSGTANGSTSNGYKLNVKGSKAILITPQVGSLSGKKTVLSITNGAVSINITEDPIYVKVYGESVNQRVDNQEILSEVILPVQVYPNPASGVAYVNVAAGQVIKSVSFFDGQGLLVKTLAGNYSDKIQFDAGSLSSGVYSLKIIVDGNENPLVTKFVVGK